MKCQVQASTSWMSPLASGATTHHGTRGNVLWYNIPCMKEITTSLFSFDRIIANGSVYVDKTDLLAKLARVDGGQFFISRPRRFGKSLMLSTLKCIFEGRRELFAGLKITASDYDWKTYPVMSLDMSSVSAATPEGLALALGDLVDMLSRQLNLPIERVDDPAVSFERLWKRIVEANLQVVVLVDEYDMPLQGCLNDPVTFERVRKMMHDFYVRLKTYSGNIRFLMLTGVTKLAKLSVFSGLNNLTDLSMSRDYAGLLGYTHAELKEYFAEHIAAFATSAGTSAEEIYSKLLSWYDNYRFSAESAVKVLNPVSVGNALANQLFDMYWNATGAPTLVMEALKKAGRWPSDLDHVEVMKTDLDVCDAASMPVTPLLYQSGYLTIKDADSGFLTLGIPNKEVRNALVRGHMAHLVNQDNASPFNARSFKAGRALMGGRLDEAVALFRSAIAALPYEWLIKDEGAVKVAFLDFFQAMDGASVHAEREIANGRIDAIVETNGAVYIFEFKYNRTAQEAYDQILEKGYHLPYLNPHPAQKETLNSTTQLSTLNSQLSKKVWGIGLNFNPAPDHRGIDPAVVNEIA